MKQITDLKLQTRKKDRFNIYLDNKFFCGLQAEMVVKYGLKIGQEIAVEKLEKMQFDSEKQVAFNKVLNLISKNLKTQKQIEDYLLKKGYTLKLINYVVKKLEEYKYVDDKGYAKRYMEDAKRTKGIRKIKQDLMIKGVPLKIIEDTLKHLPSQESELEKLAKKYMRNKEKTRENYSKLYAYLTRRGFLYDQIQEVIKFEGE